MNTEKAVLTQTQMRKFLRLGVKAGGEIVADVINYKRIVTSDNTPLFNAVKVKKVWKCEIHPMFLNDLKSIL